MCAVRAQGEDRAEGVGRWRRGTRHDSARRCRGASGGRPRRARWETAPRGEVEKHRGGTESARWRVWLGSSAHGWRRDGDERRGDGVATGKEEMVARAVL